MDRPFLENHFFWGSSSSFTERLDDSVWEKGVKMYIFMFIEHCFCMSE